MAYKQDGRFYPAPTESRWKQLPSVTTVLKTINKEALNVWRVQQGAVESKRIADETAELGSKFHHIVDQLLQGNYRWESKAFQAELRKEHPNLKGMLETWREWWNEKRDGEHVESETTVYSEMYGYAGTRDEMTTNRVYDWKACNRLYPEVVLQATAYSFATAEMLYRKENPTTKADSTVLMQMRNVLRYQPKPITAYRADRKKPRTKSVKSYPFSWYQFGVFVSLLNVYRWNKEWKWRHDERGAISFNEETTLHGW